MTSLSVVLLQQNNEQRGKSVFTFEHLIDVMLVVIDSVEIIKIALRLISTNKFAENVPKSWTVFTWNENVYSIPNALAFWNIRWKVGLRPDNRWSRSPWCRRPTCRRTRSWSSWGFGEVQTERPWAKMMQI